jgi:hypothetical protein
MTTLNEESLNLLQKKSFPDDEIQFIILGDSHINSYGWNGHTMQHDLDKNGERYKKILQHIVKHHGSSAAFVIHGGDAIGDGVIKGISKAKQKEANFRAFVDITKEILFPKELPIFVTIGNHDFILEDDELSPRLFEAYIGPVKGEILIPDSNIAYIYLPTYFEDLKGSPYFYEEDLEWLKRKLVTHPSDHYLIDFHADLRVGAFKQNSANDHYALSANETQAFFQHISASVKGIFNHHRHFSYEYTASFQTPSGTHQVPYLVTGCGGNSTSRNNSPNYFVCTMSNLDTSEPSLDFTPVTVPGLQS